MKMKKLLLLIFAFVGFFAQSQVVFLGGGTTDQQMSLVGNTLLLSGSASVDLSPYLDNSDNQTVTDFSLTGTVLTLTIEGGNAVTVDLSSLSGGGGFGDVVGPVSAVDNSVIRFDGTTGKLIQGSGVTIDDSGNIAAPGTVDGRDVAADGTKLDGIEASADVTDEANVVSSLSGATLIDIGTPAIGDKILIQDASDSDNLRYADFSTFGDGTGTDDQTAGEVQYSNTTSGLTAANIQDAIDELESEKVQGNITGRTSVIPITNIFAQNYTDFIADGDAGVGEVAIVLNSPPMEENATATIDCNADFFYDDRALDAGTITLQNVMDGGEVTVYINRVSAPSFSGTNMTFNQIYSAELPFQANTEMVIRFKATGLDDGLGNEIIDYYYAARE